MAHRKGHRNVTAWLLDEEADRLERLAKENERSMAAELRLAVRSHIASTTPLGVAALRTALRQEAGAS